MTIVNGWILPPADVQKTDLGNIIEPSRTAFTDEQVEKIKACPHTSHYFHRKVGILVWGETLPDDDVPQEGESEFATPADVPTSKGTEEDEGKASLSKPLDKMNREELVRRAQELNIPVANEDTKAVLLTKIQAATAV